MQTDNPHTPDADAAGGDVEVDDRRRIDRRTLAPPLVDALDRLWEEARSGRRPTPEVDPATVHEIPESEATLARRPTWR
ncbi:MAG: hypothetical protein ACLGIR_13550 [Actinomycetes bacterium]